MRSKSKERPFEDIRGEIISENDYCLVLFNDDVNNFDFIIESLIEVCKHDPVQAEQCTFIAHYKGKCEIKLGSFDLLDGMKHEFDRRKISTLIYQN